MTTTTLDIKTLKPKHGEFLNHREMLQIIEEERCSTIREQFMSFDINGKDLCVGFEVYFEGRSILEKGDYYTPDFISTEITNQEINLEGITLDGDEIELHPDTISLFIKLIENNIN